ncbi:MAG: extracellular solute-binding protein [Lachnospiraceae bacterium]|nr:extracellular solute-binding protein [Lachnospiraceae bacterium]
MAVGVLCASMLLGCVGCGDSKETAGETIVLRILENDTAKKEGYLDALLEAFNAEYKDKGIQAVDANMDEYTDLAANGPYGYGPDVIYQANDKLMTYAEDKHILPIDVESLDCYSVTPEAAWEAFKINIDGTTYTCGIPVNIQEPMLFYRLDMMPEDWESNWDKDGNKVADFFENWNDLYAYSKYLRDTDTSANGDSQYGFMSSLNNLYLNGEFLFSYGAYVFGSNDDGTLNAADIGLSAGDAAKGLMAMKQMASLMNEGCIDDTIIMKRYEKLADGSYFCVVSTPDTYSLFIEKLALAYEAEGLSAKEAEEKAKENLMMIELPGKLPADGDLTKSSDAMTEDDWIDTVVMGGVNGYGISSYTKYKDACMEFVNFATSYEMIQTRMNTLGIAPTRSDVAEASGGVTDMIFESLSEGRIYLMPSIKAVDQIWVPAQSLMGDIAKDPYREAAGELGKYVTIGQLEEAIEKVDQDIYDAIFTLKD